MIVSRWLLRNQFSHLIAIIIFTITLLLSLFLVYTFKVKAVDSPLRGERIITVYDQSAEKTFASNAKTVKDALKKANIDVGEFDRVEPALNSQLIADSYTVNVYRARPLLVIDGSHRDIILSAAQSAEQVAEDAGITLYDEDITHFEQSDDLLSDKAAESFVIKRAIPINLTLFGDSFVARTQAKTVGEFVSEKEIMLSKDIRASLPLNEPITPNMKLRIWREGKQTVTRDEVVEFEVEQIQDLNRKIGYREIKTPGVKGERSVTYEITVRDGKEVGRKEISSYVKRKPKKQVEIVGAKIIGPEAIIEKIKVASRAKGIDERRVLLIAKCESSFNPQADSGHYKGIFQHDPIYWPARAASFGYPGASYYDIDAQIGVSTSMMANGGWYHWGCDPGPQ